MDISIGPMINDAVQYAVELSLVTFLGFVAKKVKDKDAQNLIDQAATNAAAWAKSYADGKTQNVTLHASFAGTNPMLAAGVQYMVDHVPDAMKWAGLTDPNVMAQKIMARYTKLFENTPAVDITALQPGELVSSLATPSTQVVVHPGSTVTVNQVTADPVVDPLSITSAAVIVDTAGNPVSSSGVVPPAPVVQAPLPG